LSYVKNIAETHMYVNKQYYIVGDFNINSL